jgi:glycosyltransferase involved in cell wall biosynthesis
MRVLWLGTYERDYPRARILIAGLREIGVEVVECHRPLWERTRHKAGAFLSPARLARTGGQFAAAWAGLLAEQRRLGPVDAIVAGYPAQPDVLPAWVVARSRRVPLVVDALISLSDTLAGDRARVGGAAAAVLRTLDRQTLRRGQLVIADTEASASALAASFGLVPQRVAVVPVGAEPDLFAPASEPGGEPHALFYGKLSPLHGLETVLAAARARGSPPVRMIGDGQLGPWLAAELARDRPPGLTHEPWVAYERLGAELAASAICLGIFGTSEKAARVVPNKVYQAMAVGRPIVTADTPAAREVLTPERDALLVPAGDAAALAAALARLAGDSALRARLGGAARERFLEMGTPAAVARPLHAALAALARV